MNKSNSVSSIWSCPTGVFTATHRIDSVDQLAWLAELHEALPQVVERSLHEDLLLFVVVQQVVPQRLPRKRLGVPDNDHSISSPRVRKYFEYILHFA